MQARIKQLNKFAEYVSCCAYLLNLVEKCAAECCEEANIFFAFVENIYTFFSAFTNRWSLLTAALSNGNQTLTIKHMSDTRWSARADSTKALFSSYSTIMQAVCKFAKQVKYTGILSTTTLEVTSGVPQGSNLGPLLFLIYVNDFKNCLNDSDSLMFADDTSIFLQNKDIKELFDAGNKELQCG